MHNFLALANPLAALRQRDPLQRAGQLGGEIIHADAHQAGAFADRPGVAGMVAQVFRYLEAADQRGLQTRHGVVRFRGNLQRRLQGAAGAEMVNQQKRRECEENQ